MEQGLALAGGGAAPRGEEAVAERPLGPGFGVGVGVEVWMWVVVGGFALAATAAPDAAVCCSDWAFSTGAAEIRRLTAFGV